MATNPDNKTLVVIVGPTAVGKTAMALEVARFFKTEIISADSRQVFRELTIGTAKPTPAELRECRHHFVNTHSINEQYDAAAFGRDALAVIHELFQTKDVVIMCGGSGLYIKAVLEGFDDIPEIPSSVRDNLISNYEQSGLPWLQERMLEQDPDHYAVLDQQNPHRLIRALEVKMGTGFSISHFQKKKKNLTHNFKIVKIGIELPREILNKKIDDRMDQMIATGLFQEAERLFPLRQMQALQTVGYQEIFAFMEGEYDREEAVRLLKRNTRRYAKRQMTWFRRDNEIAWFPPDKGEDVIRFIQARM